MPDALVESSPAESPILPYAVPEVGRRFDALTIVAVTCALISPVLAVSAYAHGSDVLLILVPVLAVAAIVLGKVAHKRLHGNDPRDSVAGYASRLGTIELGLVVFLVVVSLFLPHLGASRESANRKKCASNMELIGDAIKQYACSNGGQYPAGLDVLVLEGRLKAESIVCPSSNHETAPGQTSEEVVQHIRSSQNYCSVVYLGAGLTTGSVSSSRVVAYEYVENHEKDGIHVLHGDGKVWWWEKDDAAYIITELKAGQNPPNMRSRVRMW
jgi:competence protein ComGC